MLDLNISYMLYLVWVEVQRPVTFAFPAPHHVNGGIDGPAGELVEIFGMAVADVTEALKITRIEIFYDADAIMRQLACP